MRNVIKRSLSLILTLVMAVSLCIPAQTLTAYAAGGATTLSEGNYIVNLTEVGYNGGHEISYNKINLFPRALLLVKGSTYTLQVKVHGYSEWETLQMYSQTSDVSVADRKPGTDWTAYDGKSMDGYSEQAGLDESQNDNWSQISRAGADQIDEKLDTGIISIPLDNLDDVFTLGGYAATTRESNGSVKELKQLAQQTWRLELSTVTDWTNLAYAAYGWGGDNLNFDTVRGIPIVTNIQYDSWDTQTGLFAGGFIESTICTGNNGVVTAQFKVSEDAREEITGVYLLEEASLDNVFSEKPVSDTWYQGYLIGTYGNSYGDNIYDSANRTFSVDFSGNNPSMSLFVGVDVKITTTECPDGYRAVVYLSEGGTTTTLTDEASGASYETWTKYISADARMTVTTDENANEYPVEQIKLVADGDKWKAWSFSLTDSEGNDVVPLKGGYVKVPIPKEWDMDNIYIAYYRGQGKNTDSDAAITFQRFSSIVDNGEERYLIYRTTRYDWINDGTIVMCQVMKEADLSQISEDGLYKANVKFMKADSESTLSMANGALESDALVKVENGVKEIYLNFHPIEMNKEEGYYAYLGDIWNADRSDSVYFDYETDDTGALLDNEVFNAITEFACLKSVKITLSDDTIVENSYTLKVISPAMGANSTYNEVYNSPIDANLKLYNVAKIVDESTVQIPTYQKSVLRRSIDKAKLYQKDSYSEETWQALQTALNDGETFYNTLGGTDAGTDKTISEQIKAKADAIENALSSLEENEELTEARAGLMQAVNDAKVIELGDKTVSAFNELQSAISEAEATANRSNVSVDELKEALANLQNAILAFKQSAAASTLEPDNLEDGSYKVYVDMKKVDKTTDSMANNAIAHWINLEVKDGVYTATLDLNGMTISGQFGYLKSLNYYDAGYSYDGYGEPQGTLKVVNVVSTQKNTDGSDVTDRYNQAEGYLYPDVVSFPLVDKGTENYVPLQVYVPVMEAITPGTGTQNVLMEIDWTSLRTADDDTQDVFTFDEDGVYTLTAGIRDAGSGDASDYAGYLKEARLLVKDNQVQVYLDFQKNGDSFIKEIEVLAEDGAAAEVSGAVDSETGEILRAVFTLPRNVELTDIKLTDTDDTSSWEGQLYLALRSAQLQNVNKTNLLTRIEEAEKTLENSSAYTEASVKILEEALENAKTVAENPVAVVDEVSSAGVTLRNALETMEEKTVTVNKDALKTAVDNAKQVGNEGEIYTEESWQTFQKAIEEAEKVLGDTSATQAGVDAQVTALEAAYAGLVKKGSSDSTDKDALKELIQTAGQLNGEDYTKTSWDALNSTYQAALAVLNDETASQTEINAHVQALQAAMDALVPYKEVTTLADGIYEINGTMVHATNKDQLSMGDGALERDENGVKKPLYLIVKDGVMTLRLRFAPLTIDWGDSQLTGYLGQFGYLTYGEDDVPTNSEEVFASTTEYYYIGYDQYNDPEFGTDSYMTGLEDSRYPEQVTIPVDYNDEEIWVRVYVPVMEAIGSGGLQYARLQLDWANIRQIRDESIDVSVLASQIENAKKVEQGKASDNTWKALQDAILSAETVYNTLSSTQEQINAQASYLQKAMAAVAAENEEKADKTQLQSFLSQAEEKLKQTDIYTEESLDVLKAVKASAELVFEDTEAEQSEVDAAAVSLKAAIDNLTEKQQAVDTSALEAKIAEAKELAEKTDIYTESSINALKIAIRNAESFLSGSNITETAVNNQVNALNSAIKALTERENVDRSALEAKIAEAKSYLENESKYTASSLANLQTAIINAMEVYQDKNASQAGVNAQVTALNAAISALEEKGGDVEQDIKQLADGVYSLTGTMVKIDRSTASMSNEAVNHTVKLTVKDGRYYISLDFKGLTVGERLGYLSQLKYFTTGYTLDKYGNPVGNLADVTVESYQLNSDGTKVSDNYGTDYPDVVTFELIPEALDDGYVPLQVFVPIMEGIADGTGTQPVFLKLDWSTLTKTTADDPNFNGNGDNGNNNNSNNNGGGNNNNGSNLNGGSSLGGGSSLNGGSSLSGGSLNSGTNSLSGSSSLKSGTSTVKTGDEAPVNAWVALCAISALAMAVALIQRKKSKSSMR